MGSGCLRSAGPAYFFALFFSQTESASRRDIRMIAVGPSMPESFSSLRTIARSSSVKRMFVGTLVLMGYLYL